MPGTSTLFLRVPYAAQLAAVAILYFAAARLSLPLAIPPGYATAVWPPSGIALAAALLLGRRIWPAIWIGAALANLPVESSAFSAVAIASGNTLEALAGCALIGRYAGDPARFERGEDVLKFIALCAVASAIAASAAMLPLAAGHAPAWQDYLFNWWTWWQGDLSGMIVITPLILSWSARSAEAWPAEKKTEAACFGVLLLGTAGLIASDTTSALAPFSLTFVALPFLLWAALRFGQREASTAIAVACAVAVWYVVEHREVFTSSSLNELLLMLLTFNCMVVATGLVLAAVVRERGRAMDALRQKHDRLESFAHYDPLTGLPNATLFRQQLAQLLGAAAKSGRKLAVALVDIERFETINHTFGREGGDDLLKQVSGRLAADMTATDLIARAGGDRFALASHGFADETAVAQLVGERMARWFGTPYRLRTNELRLAAHVGLALFPDDGEHPDVLYTHAESALKKAKASGERSVFYTQKMSERVAEKLALENRLRRAVEQEQFVLHYQPKVNVRSRRLTGLEALLRWQSPELGLVPAVQFIPLLEQTGLILEVGRWALRQAVLDQKRWAQERVAPPRVAVNVSPIQLRRAGFVDEVGAALADAAHPPLIDLEITESCVMEDIETNVGKLGRIRELGIGVAIDDFGTGYSSLAYLAKLPANILKIDQSFTAWMLGDDDTMALVHTILSLAKALKLSTVAEGVESEAQADLLELLGCEEMQGYYISAPLPRDEIMPLLAAE